MFDSFNYDDNQDRMLQMGYGYLDVHGRETISRELKRIPSPSREVK